LLEIAKLEQEILQACQSVLNRVSVNFSFYEKFTRIWDGLGVKDKSLSVASAQKTKCFAWQLFICAKIKLLKCDDILNTALLLYAVLKVVTLNLPPEVEMTAPLGFLEQLVNLVNNKQDASSVVQVV
jgi:hypothetical protein